MNSALRAQLALGLCGALAACGGGSAGSGSYNSLLIGFNETASALGVKGQITDAKTTPLSALPTGAVQYAGQIALTTGAEVNAGASGDSEYLGRLNLSAQFTPTGGTVSGSASQFVDDRNRSVGGTLAIGTVAINRGLTDAAGAVFAPSVTGDLTTPSGAVEKLDGDAAGTFAGPNAVALLFASGATDAAAGTTQFTAIGIAK